MREEWINVRNMAVKKHFAKFPKGAPSTEGVAAWNAVVAQPDPIPGGPYTRMPNPAFPQTKMVMPLEAGLAATVAGQPKIDASAATSAASSSSQRPADVRQGDEGEQNSKTKPGIFGHHSLGSYFLT